MMCEDREAEEILDMLARRVEGDHVGSNGVGIYVADKDDVRIAWLGSDELEPDEYDILFSSFEDLRPDEILSALLEVSSCGITVKTESGEVFMKAHATLDELRVMLDLEGERKQVPPRWLVHKMQELEVIEKGGDGLEMLYLGCKSIEEALARRDLLCIPSRHAFETLGVAWDARKA